MTVEATTTENEYLGGNGVTSFEFTFRVDDASWVQVYLGTETSEGVLQSSGYSLELHADQGTTPGGHVVFAEAPDGIYVRIRRAVPLQQIVDYRAGEAFPSETHEQALDRIVMMLQDEVAARARTTTTAISPTIDVGGATVTPAGSVVAATVSAWLARVAVDGGPIPVAAGGGVRRTLAGWIDTILSEAGGGGITTPTGNRIGAGTITERDAITDWVAGDIWFDSANGWHPYRFDGIGWVDIINPYLSSRTRTFVQDDAPANPTGGVPLVEGDLWFDSDAGYAVCSWDGVRWVTVRDTGAIDAARLLGTIDMARLADGSIDAAKIAAAMKGDGVNPVAWLAANAIGATHILANSITAGKLVAGAVTARELAAEAVTAGKIQAGCITAVHIAAGQVVLPGGVIGAINASGEGILISGDRVNIAGSVTFQDAIAGKADASAVQDALAAKLDLDLGNVTTINGGKIQTRTIDAASLKADAIKTTNFASSGSGDAEVASAGAKMQRDGTALLVGPRGLKVGKQFIDGIATGVIFVNGGGATLYSDSLMIDTRGTWVTSNGIANCYRIMLPAVGNFGLPSVQVKRFATTGAVVRYGAFSVTLTGAVDDGSGWTPEVANLTFDAAANGGVGAWLIDFIMRANNGGWTTLNNAAFANLMFSVQVVMGSLRAASVG